MSTRSSPPLPCSRLPCISTTLTVPRSDHCYKNLGQSCAHYFDVAPLPCSTFQTNNFPRLALTRPWCYCVGVNKCCFMFLMFLSVKELLSYTIISPFTWLARASCVSVSRFRVVTSTVTSLLFFLFSFAGAATAVMHTRQSLKNSLGIATQRMCSIIDGSIFSVCLYGGSYPQIDASLLFYFKIDWGKNYMTCMLDYPKMKYC